MARKKDEIQKEVIRRGGTVLQSGIFRKIMQQKHHNVTLGVHSIGVAEDSIKIADVLEKIGIHADRDALVRASLCHDLGMLGRSERYKSGVEMCRKHPKDGLKNARKVIPSLSRKEEDAILHHMFPTLAAPPRTLEGLIICFADKKSAIREVFKRPGKKIDEKYLKETES